MATRPRVRVRTGCLTCKARKIKCDESRPSCWRCTTSGRSCDGYIDAKDALRVSAKSSTSSHAIAGVRSTPGFDRLLSSALANDEHRWLDHFSSHTGPALSGCQDYGSFWSVELPQLSLSVPAIRHALLAVSSCHARFETQLGSTKQTIERDGPGFTIKHYSLAIASLRKLLALQDTNPEVPLICCLLFICLECLYGNTVSTLTHLENGLKILDSSRFHDGNCRTLKSVKEKLEPIFHKFRAQSTVFGMSASFSTSTHESMDFADILVAKTALDELITACMLFVKHKHNDYGERQSPADDPKRALQTNLLDQLLAWETQMQFLGQSDPPLVDLDDASVIMLHIRQQATYVYVAMCLDPHETFCDSFLPRFKGIIDLIELFMARSNESTTPLLSSAFSLESSLIPSLWLTALKCRHPTTRRRAIRLLETHRGREGLWDARLCAKAAARIVEIEETTLPLQQQGSPLWPDEPSRVYRADVHRTSEDPARSARLLIHTAPNGYFGDKVIWSEDITF